MKNTILGLFTLFTVIGVQANETMEEEFKSRFLEFVASEDLSMKAMETVWIYGDIPTKEYIYSQATLELAILKEIKSIELVEIYPKMKETMREPIVMEGNSYTMNLEPYKMLEIEYKKKTKGASAGWSKILGVKDDKLYLIGFKKL